MYALLDVLAPVRSVTVVKIGEVIPKSMVVYKIVSVHETVRAALDVAVDYPFPAAK